MNFQCTVCKKELKTSQGLKSHFTRLHKYSSASGDVSQSSPVSGDDVSQISTQPMDTSSEVPLVELLANLRCNLSLLRRIPKGARSAAADALADTIEECLRTNTVASWERLLLFPVLCLQVPKKQDDRQVSLSTLVKRNICRFKEGVSIHKITSKLHSGEPSKQADRLSKCVVAKLSDGDLSGAVRMLSSDDIFAPRNSDTLSALSKKHPPHDSELIIPVPNEGDSLASYCVREEDVKAAVSSFPSGSAGGLDMLRPQHLKDMLSHSAGVAGVRLCSSLTSLSNVMLSGKVPPEICPVLYGASLCALKKKDGGIRPIALGSTFRRLVAKMCCAHIASKLGVKLSPVQVGFGVRGGIEAASHAARRFVSFKHRSPKILFKIDFFNAFNMVRRDLILQSVLDQAPDLFGFVSQCYSNPSHLAFVEDIIPSVRGIQQGDPLGPALFCMVVDPVARLMKSEFNVWYLDDATLGGSPDVVLHDFEILKLRSADLGLEVNLSKCELFCLGENDEFGSASTGVFRNDWPSVKFPPRNECILLGSPVTEAAMEGCLEAKLTSLKLMMNRLVGIPSHCAYFILKNSLAIPKLSHILRCAPTWKCPGSLSSFDCTLRDAIQSIVNISLSDVAWEQSSWPVSKGGLGVRHVTDIALPAFISSSHSTNKLVEQILPAVVLEVGDNLVMEGIEEWRGVSRFQLPLEDKRVYQSEWEIPRVLDSIARLREQAATTKDKARLLGVSTKESGAFLNALPSAPLGTLLNDDAFRIAVALRLGSNMCEPHACQCGVMVDSSGTHGLCCKVSKGRQSRHASVNDIIKRALISAGVPSCLEPSYLTRENNKRPDGITQIPWKGGKSVVWDFTCTDSLAPSYVEAASVEPLSAAAGAERLKKSKYSHLSQQYLFTPVAVECLGSFGREGLNFVLEIGKRISTLTGEKKAGEYLIQRISVAVQRGNAISVLGSIPQGISMDEFLNEL